MIMNPYLPSPSAATAWAQGFVRGFVGPEYSTEPLVNISTDDASAYADGVIAGQQGAMDGLVFSDLCVSAREPHGFLAEPSHVINGLEIVHGTWEALHLSRLAAGLTGIAVSLIELACTLPVHMLPPEQVLPNLGQPIVETLSAYGVESLELFCAAGLDVTSHDCEILLSPMYKSLEQARRAAMAMGRDQWVVASWRTDASNSFRITQSS